MSTMKIKIAAIKELENNHGRITAELLVQAARNKNHPLHKDFIWDDKKAAHQHRIYTAREIISSVRVVITRENIKVNCIGYVRDPSLPSKEQGYVNVIQLCTELDHAEEAVLAEVSRAQSALKRGRDLAMGLDLEDVFEAALTATIKIINGLGKRASTSRPPENGKSATL